MRTEAGRRSPAATTTSPCASFRRSGGELRGVARAPLQILSLGWAKKRFTSGKRRVVQPTGARASRIFKAAVAACQWRPAESLSKPTKHARVDEIGRASCRERGEISVGGG